MRVLVTGGCGFIGTQVAIKLKSLGYTVDIVDDFSNGSLDNFSNFKIRNIPRAAVAHWDQTFESKDKDKDFTIFHCDVSHYGILKRISAGRYKHVFHLAAKPRVSWSVENPLLSTEDNFNKSIALGLACVNSNTKIIFSSTSAIYGNTLILPTNEEAPNMSESPYGISKYFVEKYFSMFEKLYGLNWVALRYFNVYGPGQDGSSPYSTAIAAWCSKASKGEPLRSDGDGTQTRDMVFIDDVVNANICAMDYDGDFKVFNIGTGEGVSNNEILSKFSDAGYKNVVNAPPRAGDVSHTLSDSSLAKEHLNWFAKTNIDDGLKKTMGWWGLNVKE